MWFGSRFVGSVKNGSECEWQVATRRSLSGRRVSDSTCSNFNFWTHLVECKQRSHNPSRLAVRCRRELRDGLHSVTPQQQVLDLIVSVVAHPQSFDTLGRHELVVERESRSSGWSFGAPYSGPRRERAGSPSNRQNAVLDAFRERIVSSRTRFERAHGSPRDAARRETPSASAPLSARKQWSTVTATMRDAAPEDAICNARAC